LHWLRARDAAAHSQLAALPPLEFRSDSDETDQRSSS
jgi:hypothetical protein